jgi:hypothetical protein
MGFGTWLRAQWDRVFGFTLVGLGAVLLVLGYVGVSESIDTPEALSYFVSGGLGSLFLLGVGATQLIRADLHDEWRKLDRVEAALNRTAQPPVTSVEGSPAAGARSGTEVRRVTQSLQTSHHFPALAMAVPGASAAVRNGQTFAVAGLAAALGLIAAGWWGTASTTSFRSATWGLAVATSGLILTGLTAAGSTLGIRRTIQRRKFRLLASWMAAPPGADLASAPPSQDNEPWILVAEGLTEYHRLTCPAVAGLTTREVQRPDVPQGLRPCLLCEA